MVIRSKVTIPALTGGKERTAYVYLPVTYHDSGAAGVRYPVLYMFDGHNLFDDREATFGTSWGLGEYLDKHKIPLIVCAVECNHEGNSRLSEYSPVSFDFRGERIIGRGKKYMDWLTREFKPAIDGQYRTKPDREHTFIAGSSMGGLMTVYSLAKYGDVFSKGAGLSPSLWVEGEEIPSFIANGKFKKDAILFTDYGTKEFKNHSAQLKIFGETVRLLIEKGVAVTARVVPGGTHSEQSWRRELPYMFSVLGF